MILGNPLLNIIEITQYNIYDAYTAYNLATDMVAITMVIPLHSVCIYRNSIRLSKH